MIRKKLEKLAKPAMAAAGGLLLVAALLATMSLTTFDPRWTVFLTGVLATAVLSGVSRAVNARWTIARRNAQLGATRSKLATEIRLRAHAEEMLQRFRGGAELIDEGLPAMLVYVDVEQRIRYHNRAFHHMVGGQRSAIDGRRIDDVVGHASYREIQEHLLSAIQGKEARFEWTRHGPGGDTSRLDVQYLPNYAGDGKVAGVFAILTDITRAHDLVVAPAEVEEEVPPDMAARLVSALEHDEFTLYWQAIATLRDGGKEVQYHEVLLRMNEEEEKQIPPGTFLPWAEQLGLLHEIDRWVVRHVADFAARTEPAVYMVNLSAPTIRDPQFAPFVRKCLAASGIPGERLGFELVESEVLADLEAYRTFIAALEGTGCRIAVSGFGSSPLSLRLLKQIGVQILKLDGSIVLAVERNPTELAKVKSINRAAHACGMQTVAECVENNVTLALLKSVDTDFAQGFGIAKPRPMVVPVPTLAQSAA